MDQRVVSTSQSQHFTDEDEMRGPNKPTHHAELLLLERDTSSRPRGTCAVAAAVDQQRERERAMSLDGLQQPTVLL
jgi:hypothetical protein